MTKLLLLGVVLLALYGCGAQQETSSSLDWKYDWLKNKMCQPPCWQSITPAVSTVDEVTTLLRSSLLVKKGSVSVRNENLSPTVVIWEYDASSEKGEILFNKNADGKVVVYHIRPYFNILYKLEDVINAFGTPEYVIATHRRGMGDIYYIDFLFLKYGFALLYSSQTEPSLNKNMLLQHSGFFVPTLDGYKATNYRSGNPAPWKGFVSFNEYCKYSSICI